MNVDLSLPDLPVVHTWSTSLSSTSHRARLPLPLEVREPSTRSRMETACFYWLSVVARHQHSSIIYTVYLLESMPFSVPSSDGIFTVPSSEDVPTVA